MDTPKVTEYTTVHVDDSLSKDVSVRTRVNVYTSEQLRKSSNKNVGGLQKHQAMVIGDDYTAINGETVSTEIMAENSANKLSSKGSAKQKEEGIEIISGENKEGAGDNVINQGQIEKKTGIDLNAKEGNAIQVSDKDGELTDGTKMIARIEKHKLHVMEHNLVVSGVKVSERKERTTVTQEDINGTGGDGRPIKTILVHSRAIGDRLYTVNETRDKDEKVTDTTVVTKMSEDEIKKFEADWIDYWIPTISDEQIESGEFQEQIRESDEKVLEFESIDRESAPAESDISIQDEPESIIIEAERAEGGLIEVFVRRHPLKVFYFGLTMLLVAIMVFQCCFLPEYPPCSWINCILECIKEANAAES